MKQIEISLALSVRPSQVPKWVGEPDYVRLGEVCHQVLILEGPFQALLMEKQIQERVGGRGGGEDVEAVGPAWQQPGQHWSGHRPLTGAPVAAPVAVAVALDGGWFAIGKLARSRLETHCLLSMDTFPTVSRSSMQLLHSLVFRHRKNAAHMSR